MLPSLVPPQWNNQPLILYHGTVETEVFSILRGVEPSCGRLKTDFGAGFYTTTLLRQAQTWALRQVRWRRRGKSAVIQFEVSRDELATLDCLWFFRGHFEAEDFWSFVFHCRTGGKAHLRKSNQGWYDLVAGPATASWEQRLVLADVDQISFHTERAAEVLNRSNRKRVL